jgi:hypothetical protein
MGTHIFCIIDMDNKNKEPERTRYKRLRAKFAKPINKPKKGISCKVEFFETHLCTELFFFLLLSVYLSSIRKSRIVN